MDINTKLEIAIQNKKFIKEIIKLPSFEETIKEEVKENPFLFFFSSKFNTNIGKYIEKKITPDVINKLSLKGVIETKTTRIIEQRKSDTYSNIINRALKFKDGKKELNISTFNQIKPNNFDYLLGYTIYKDKIEVYLLKKEDISLIVGTKEVGKIKLRGQHPDALIEGQILLKDCFSKKIGEVVLEKGKYKFIKY